MEGIASVKKVIIIAYFGAFPNYFKLFIDSCKHNDDFYFLVFTDQEAHTALPSNMQWIHMSFSDMCILVKQKLGKEYNLFSPYKLCDYRPAYGKIFEDYIQRYDVWGYCDTDIVFGKIGRFIDDTDFGSYDRLLVNGHLTFYKNTRKVNNYFKSNNLGYVDFKRATSIKEPFFFDEVFSTMILRSKNVDIYENTQYLDILPQYFDMTIKETRKLRNYANQKLFYENGHIFQEFINNGQSTAREYMYIHLQKRRMTFDEDKLNIHKRVYINANIFTNNREEVTNDKRPSYHLRYIRNQIKKLTLNRIKIKLLILLYSKKEKLSNGQTQTGDKLL